MTFMRGLTFPGGREPMLRGKEVYLRYPRMSDYTAWAALRAESREFHAPFEPERSPDELTRGAFRRRLKRYHREIRTDAAYPFFVFRAENDEPVGAATLSNVRRGVTQSCSLGYWVGVRFARQGLTYDAVRALVPFVFGTLRLHRLEAACLPDNEASRNLLLKAGFKEEGQARSYLHINGAWRDHVLFALIAEDVKLG